MCRQGAAALPRLTVRAAAAFPCASLPFSKSFLLELSFQIHAPVICLLQGITKTTS